MSRAVRTIIIVRHILQIVLFYDWLMFRPVGLHQSQNIKQITTVVDAHYL